MNHAWGQDRNRLLASVLAHPHRISGMDQHAWEHLIWQARNAELMGQLHGVLERAGALGGVPGAPLRHLQVAGKLAAKHGEAVAWELRNLHEALSPLGMPVILLKGAAYCAHASRAAEGRIFNDLDILVPKPALKRVEEHLTRAGWLPAHTNAYDERYYREWMHEIPPMEHKNRCSVLDVHHAILAPTSGIRADPHQLFDASIPLGDGWPLFRVLCAEDMVMHSATHLFFGEFHKGLRDLFDVHTLVTEYSAQAGFWTRLVSRSQRMGLLLPVRDALHHAHRLFDTELPEGLLQSLDSRATPGWPNWIRDWLFEQVLRPQHASASGPASDLARWCAFARSHWLRMHFPLLFYHLSHKLIAPH